LRLLDESPIIKEHQTVELKTVGLETFSFKIRAKITDEFSLQIRYLQDEGFIRYSYQLFTTKAILRWDNAEHFPELPNFPHHFHDERGNKYGSKLKGDLLADIQIVLVEIERYLREKGSIKLEAGGLEGGIQEGIGGVRLRAEPCPYASKGNRACGRHQDEVREHG
jgi:hypothetical protein